MPGSRRSSRLCQSGVNAGPSQRPRTLVEAACDEGYEKAADLWVQNPFMGVAMECAS